MSPWTKMWCRKCYKVHGFQSSNSILTRLLKALNWMIHRKTWGFHFWKRFIQPRNSIPCNKPTQRVCHKGDLSHLRPTFDNSQYLHQNIAKVHMRFLIKTLNLVTFKTESFDVYSRWYAQKPTHARTRIKIKFPKYLIS